MQLQRQNLTLDQPVNLVNIDGQEYCTLVNDLPIGTLDEGLTVTDAVEAQVTADTSIVCCMDETITDSEGNEYFAYCPCEAIGTRPPHKPR